MQHYGDVLIFSYGNPAKKLGIKKRYLTGIRIAKGCVSMPKLSAIKGSIIIVVHSHSRFEGGIMWGCLAGAVLGAGFTLDVDFFSGSAANLICMAVAGTSVTGAVFGHAMAGMLEKEIAVRKMHNNQLVADAVDLSEHKALKLQIRAKQIAINAMPIPCASIIAPPSQEGQSVKKAL